MHCPIASDHVVPKHVRSVHTKHNLWPWGRRGRSQHVGNSGQGMEEGAQSPRGRGLTEGRWGHRTPSVPRASAQNPGSRGRRKRGEPEPVGQAPCSARMSGGHRARMLHQFCHWTNTGSTSTGSHQGIGPSRELCQGPALGASFVMEAVRLKCITHGCWATGLLWGVCGRKQRPSKHLPLS